MRLFAYLVILGLLAAILWQWPFLWEIGVLGAIGGAWLCFWRQPSDE